MVYADGPTRVLCFSDEPTTQLFEAEQSVLDLAARLKQVDPGLHFCILPSKDRVFGC